MLLGYYAVLISQTGRLVSTDFNFTRNDYCLNFWYFLEGDRNTQLKIQKALVDNDPKTIWTDIAEPNIKGQWMHARASITGLSDGDYTVSFAFNFQINRI